MYDGTVVRTLEGADINERELIGSALNIAARPVESEGNAVTIGTSGRMALLVSEQQGDAARRRPLRRDVRDLCLQPSGGASRRMCVQTASNKAILLAFVAMAQCLVVITAGIDLFGRHGFGAVQLPCIVAGGRHTAADRFRDRGRACRRACMRHIERPHHHLRQTAADRYDHRHKCNFFGLALLLRPTPGGSVNEALADVFTSKLFGMFPTSPAVLAATILPVWVPFSRSVLRPCGLCGWLGGECGLYVRRAAEAGETGRLCSCRALVGNGRALPDVLFLHRRSWPSLAATPHTLYSIAAVVLGGVFAGGRKGSAVGAVFGALAFRTIGDLLFVFDFDPLWQPLFQGVVLMLAIGVGSIGLARVRNRLEWFQ